MDAEANEVEISIFNSHEDVYAYDAETENNAWEDVSEFNVYDAVSEYEELMDSEVNEELIADKGVPSIFDTLI